MSGTASESYTVAGCDVNNVDPSGYATTVLFRFLLSTATFVCLYSLNKIHEIISDLRCLVNLSVRMFLLFPVIFSGAHPPSYPPATWDSFPGG
jgi:hypothetical protein